MTPGVPALHAGSIASIIEKYGSAASRRAAYREKMVELHAFLNRHDIPYHLTAQMASYYSDVWIRSLRQTDDAALLRELPEDLRCEVSFHILAGLSLHSSRVLDWLHGQTIRASSIELCFDAQ
jgi:hypothetical protein